jgi:hypothetical protein
MGARSKRGTQESIKTIGNYVGGVKKLWHRHVLNASQAFSLINRAFMNEAKAFGLTGAAAKQLAGVQTLQSTGIHTTGRARGGLVQFGRPGDRGPDSIPAMFGSQPVVVGSGEVGAVFNGPQIAEMNAELAHRGGLRGFFDRKRWPRHSEGTPARAERGGVVKGYARGGVADFGGHPQNVAPGIRRLIAVMQSHFPLGVTSTTDHSLMTTSGNVSDHSTGHAVDLASSPSIMFRAAEWIKRSGLAHSLKQGIHNPNLAVNAGQIEKPPGIFGGEVWAQHANHIHLALAGALGKFSGAALEHIKRIADRRPRLAAEVDRRSTAIDRTFGRRCE